MFSACRIVLRRVPTGSVALSRQIPLSPSVPLGLARKIRIKSLKGPSRRAYATVPLSDEEAVPADMAFSLLRFTAEQPVNTVGLGLPTEKDKLSYCWLMLITIIRYLGAQRPGGEVWLNAFGTAPAAIDSEIGQARFDTTKLLSGLLVTLSAVPPTSPLLNDLPELSQHREALLSYQSDIDRLIEGWRLVQDAPGDEEQEVILGRVIPLWTTTWDKIQPEIIGFTSALEKAGYVPNPDDLPPPKE